MKQEFHVTADLLAYLDGELDVVERVRVETHLAHCSRCTAEWNALRDLQHGLGVTFNRALTPQRLSYAADARIREALRARNERAPWFQALWLRRGALVQMVLAVVVVLNFLSLLPMAASPALPFHEVLVSGQSHLVPGAEAALRVVVRAVRSQGIAQIARAGAPLAGIDVAVRLVQPGQERTLYRGVTDSGGTAQVSFAVPDDVVGAAALVVETHARIPGQEPIKALVTRAVTINRAYKIYLTPDRPVYRPGHTIKVRALALDAHTFKPVEAALTFRVIAPQGDVVFVAPASTSVYGVAAVEMYLPLTAAVGAYTVQAEIGDTLAERSVTVGEYTPPPFRVRLEPERAFYSPGAEVAGLVESEYFFGKPVVKGKVIFRAFLGQGDSRTPVIELFGQTDKQGRFLFAFELLPFAPTAESAQVLELEAEVFDASGKSAGVRRSVQISEEQILIRAIPESGVIKYGLENTLYLYTAYPDGMAAASGVTVTVAGERYTLATNEYGLAEMRFTPSADFNEEELRCEVRAQDRLGRLGRALFMFGAEVAPEAVLLRVERAAYRVGETLQMEALVSGAGGVVYLDVQRAGQLAAVLSAPVIEGRAGFALDLDADLVGALILRAYLLRSDGTYSEDSRLVVVDMPQQLALTIDADRPAYRPRETAHLQLRVARNTAPLTATLGIAVVDESLYALDTLPPGFARAYFLLAREMLTTTAGLDTPTLLAQRSAAQDLAARAAWAGTASGAAPFRDSAYATSQDKAIGARQTYTQLLALSLVLLSVLIIVSAIHGVLPLGYARNALRRVLIGGLVLGLAAPCCVIIGALGILVTVLGRAVAVICVLAMAGVWLAAFIRGWRERDARVQVVAGELGAYLLLSALVVGMAALGYEPHILLRGFILFTFLGMWPTLAFFGQALFCEGRRLLGWLFTALALLLPLLALILPLVPAFTSALSRDLGNPALYGGPLLWLSGCSAPAAPAEVQATQSALLESPTENEDSPTSVAQPTAIPQPTVAPQVAVTPLPKPEPYPLRQIFPETLYWNPDARTDANGVLDLDLLLPDTLTSWRVTALASTLTGDLGAATYDLKVYQDFFVEMAVTPVMTRSEVVSLTVTLYNYLDHDQEVALNLAAADWYTLVRVPAMQTIRSGEIKSVMFILRPTQAGEFTLQLRATGSQMSDALAVKVVVR